MSSAFWWLNLVRLYSLLYRYYTQKGGHNLTVLGTIISPNKSLHMELRRNPGSRLGLDGALDDALTDFLGPARFWELKRGYSLNS